VYIHESENECGTAVGVFRCHACGREYTVCPAPAADRREAWAAGGCLADDCSTYDPARDADVLFMAAEEIAASKPLVSLDMLRARKSGVHVEPV
jgi:hypothetical protein